MTKLITLYFSSFIKRFFVLIGVCLLIPMIIATLNYPLYTSMAIFKDIIFLAFPWIVWIHQSMFVGLLNAQQITTRIIILTTSTLISTIMVILILPLTNQPSVTSLSQIRSHISQPRASILPSTHGTLIIDPLKLSKHQHYFAKQNTKALWIHSNLLLFQEIQTNKQHFTLSKADNFSQQGYYPQSGNQTVPFAYFTINSIQDPLAQKFVQYWFSYLTDMYLYFKEFLPAQSASSKNKAKSAFDDLLLIQEKKPLQTQSKTPNIDRKSNKKNPPKINKSSQKSKKIQSSLIDYWQLFFVLLIIFQCSSFIGVLSLKSQEFLGALSMILITSLFIPQYFYWVSSGLTFITQKVTIPFIELIILSIFYIVIALQMWTKSTKYSSRSKK